MPLTPYINSLLSILSFDFLVNQKISFLSFQICRIFLLVHCLHVTVSKLQISQKSVHVENLTYESSRLAKKRETRGREDEREKKRRREREKERTEGPEESERGRNTCRSLYPAVPRASMRGIHILSAKHRPKPGDAASRIRKVEARRGERKNVGEVGGKTRTEMAEAAIGSRQGRTAGEANQRQMN